MATYNISEEFIARLKKTAERECWCHDKDFMPYEYCGGNFDDAYYGGSDDGEALLAKSILEELGENNE